MESGGHPPIALAGNQQVSFDLADVHRLSLDLLEDISDADVTAALGAASAGLSFGRLVAHMDGKNLDADEAVNFVQALFEWVSCYFAGGKVH